MCFLVMSLFEFSFSSGVVSEEFVDGSEGIIGMDGESVGGESVGCDA